MLFINPSQIFNVYCIELSIRYLDKQVQYRLPSKDYSVYGFYFVTLNTYESNHYFGEVENKRMHLNPMGKIAQENWLYLSVNFKNISLDEYVVMPNHVHGIIRINNFPRDINKPILLGNIIRFFKARTTYFLHKKLCKSFYWEKRYYDRVIRNTEELERIRNYIRNNPHNYSNTV